MIQYAGRQKIAHFSIWDHPCTMADIAGYRQSNWCDWHQAQINKENEHHCGMCEIIIIIHTVLHYYVLNYANFYVFLIEQVSNGKFTFSLVPVVVCLISPFLWGSVVVRCFRFDLCFTASFKSDESYDAPSVGLSVSTIFFIFVLLT